MSKSYTNQAKKWIKGEAFFESLISEYAIPHKIIMPKDLGVDFICEWVHGEKPTGVLFLAQVKTISGKATKIGVEQRLN